MFISSYLRHDDKANHQTKKNYYLVILLTSREVKTFKLATKQTLTKGIDDSKLILHFTTSACYDESLNTSGRTKIVAVLI